MVADAPRASPPFLDEFRQPCSDGHGAPPHRVGQPAGSGTDGCSWSSGKAPAPPSGHLLRRRETARRAPTPQKLIEIALHAHAGGRSEFSGVDSAPDRSGKMFGWMPLCESDAVGAGAETIRRGAIDAEVWRLGDDTHPFRSRVHGTSGCAKGGWKRLRVWCIDCGSDFCIGR